MFLHDRVSAFEIMAMMCSVSGIVLIGMSETESDGDEADVYSAAHNYKIGLTFAIVATIGGSVIGVASRMLKELSFAVIQFIYSLTSSILMGICVLLLHPSTGKEDFFIYSSWTVYAKILAVCFLNMICQNIFTYANQNSSPTTVGLMIFVGVGYSFLLDLYVFKLTFSSLELIGVLICLICSISATIYKWRKMI